MFCRRFLGICLRGNRNPQALLNRFSTGKESNPFFDTRVQDLLKKLTGIDLKKVYRRRREGQRLEPPEYRFMTTADLEKARKEALIRAEKKLQMPPVLPPRQEIDYVFVEDPKLVGYSDSKFVFTDISFGKTDRSRTIVARDTNGTLRKATWDERSRMNEIYFPREGRKLTPPAMFEDKNIQSLLDKEEFEFILDRACLQFEPDDPLYLRVTQATYDRVNDTSSFNALRSTRHYGPLVYHLVANRKNIDNLLLENFATDRLQDAAWSVNLYHILNPEAVSKSFNYETGKELDLIKAFIDSDAKSRKAELQLAFNSYRDFLETPKSKELEEEVHQLI